jgi:hypothetical protein
LEGLRARGYIALVFAAGMDDRATPDKPAYPEFHAANVRYLVGGENLHWREMFARLARADGCSIELVPLPNWLIAAALLGVKMRQFIARKEGGLDLRYLATLQAASTFFDAHIAADQLGHTPASLDEAFRETVDACPKRTSAAPPV